ncbi:hypothetical protein [Pseudomonas fitomaticsae]|uniref:Uncharacterized protein n=1 Tax=Pseudomonas fitomaticsae TaxID=2837969 RepID=A0ABY3PYB9_9PSED|nr:hypothetical protein [Pseudomonas fitomaticsae]UFP98563.1 hypothetical protein KJY40_21310 [Pseudomonas fitomaticsae]
MKITIDSFDGDVLIVFSLKGKDVHWERFKGKATSPYTRTVAFDGEWDAHRTAVAIGRLDFTYEVTP